ncbi:MAG: CDP-alcohol phosphatidyltransferase family protein [Thermoplasmata archaeon]|nr:CDP-alcohol phosphatidyltransferase family protein [Thermoplasmata archaeon]MCK5397848.1 CDP-alcohol phosphatidyltransferase family protein [Thermoplasmata archaeon]
MVLDDYRSTADKFLVPMAKKLIKVNPDHISAVAIALAFLAGVLFYFSSTWAWLLIIASIVIALSSLMDALDGKVAKLAGKANLRGDFLDHVLDRYADIFLIIGITVSGYCHWFLGILGLTGVLMTSYLGTQTMAVGVKRDYGGILGRADRLVMLIFVPIITWFLLYIWNITDLFTIPYLDVSLTLFDLMLIWFAFAGHYTAIQRGRRTWTILTEKYGKR